MRWRERWYSHEGDAVNGSGRQRGKSFAAYGLLDDAVRKGGRVRYCALTIETATAILSGAMEAYLADCPSNLRPYADGYDWVYPGGGRLIVMGTDATTFRRGRGFSRIALDVRDEFCFYQDLDGVEAALNPGLMVPGPSGKPGRCLRISTPATSPGHPSKLLVDAAIASGRYELETFYDNPRVNPEQVIRKECERLGYTRAELLASTWFRREYLGEWVTEESRAAVPAWASVAAECTREEPRPSHFAGLTSHDWGGYTADPHAALFGFHDFKSAQLIIEDEDEVRGLDIGALADRWKSKEKALWGERAWDGTLWGAGFFEEHTKTLPDYLRPAVIKVGPEGGVQPFLRLCDHDDNLQGEFLSRHGYALLPTDKTEKHLHVDELNQGIREKRVVIHPRCRRLLEQLRTTLWDEKRRQWVRTERDHGDLVDCFVAGTLIETQRGPVPVESVAVGDWAVTREGLRPVAVAHAGRVAPIWRLETDAGHTLDGTAEHPCWTQRGWVPLQSLTPHDTLFAWNQSSSSGAARGGVATQQAAGETTASITCALAGGTKSTCTVPSTRPRWARSLMVLWFIIETAIRSTTRPPISRPSRAPRTSPSTWTTRAARWLLPLLAPPFGVPTFARPLPSGGTPMPGSLGTASTARMSGRACRISSEPARCAASDSRVAIPRAPGDAAPPAKQRLDDAPGSTRRVGRVDGAAAPFDATSTRPNGFVPVRVLRVTPTNTEATVFNLSVAGVHEYVANGVLVHNCLVYMWRNVPWHFDPFPPPPQDYWGQPKVNDMADLARAMTGRRHR